MALPYMFSDDEVDQVTRSLQTASRDAVMNAKYCPVPVRVIRDLVWLEFEAEPTRTASGLWLPPHAEDYGDDGKRPPVLARVVAVGPGRLVRGESPADDFTIPMGVSVGQRVLVGAYEGARIEWRGRHFIVVYEVAIHAIVEEDRPS